MEDTPKTLHDRWEERRVRMDGLSEFFNEIQGEINLKDEKIETLEKLAEVHRLALNSVCSNNGQLRDEVSQLTGWKLEAKKVNEELQERVKELEERFRGIAKIARVWTLVRSEQIRRILEETEDYAE